MKCKKIALSMLLLTVFITAGTKQEVLAASIPQNTPASLSIGVMPYAKETEWRFRRNNGKWQKRLWSITEFKWLTDWINVQ